LVERKRDQKDRRVIYGKVSAAGQKLLREMDGPVEQHGREMLRHVSQADLRRLIDLLDRVRGG
jgi:DNA-binding MarR family transcriptional regulator